MNMKRLEGLAVRRKAAGYTQQSFADELGVQRAALAAWETLRSYPSAGLLPAIADMLLCTVDDLYRAPEDGAEAARRVGEPYKETAAAGEAGA